MSKHIPMSKKETTFALAALMEIPSQYKATIDLQLLGCRRGAPGKPPLPPPFRNSSEDTNAKFLSSSSNECRIAYPSAPSTPYNEYSSHNRDCPLCHWYKKDLAFGCRHQTCYNCGLGFCPTCHTHITTTIRLYE